MLLVSATSSYSSFPDAGEAISELKKTRQFSTMALSVEEDEHSIELHLPYIRKAFEGFVVWLVHYCPDSI